jgi:glyoxylase-like metal-dependent hydrolase (beta-lactamase superfamily II)
MGMLERIFFEDIEGIRVGRYPGRVNTTSLLWRLGTTLIDTGPPNQWRFVEGFVGERPLELVVVTHHHEDHAGNLARLKEAGIPQLLAPKESLTFLADGFPLQMYRRIVWGRPARVEVEALGPTIELPGGTVLEPILFAGHAPDMTCLLDRQRGALFAADLYIASRLRYLRKDEDLAGILDSLRRALTVDFDTLLCSHRGVVGNAKKNLRRKLDFLESLCQQAAALGRGGSSLEQITRRLLGPEDLVSRISGGHFSKKNLIGECLRVASAVR